MTAAALKFKDDIQQPVVRGGEKQKIVPCHNKVDCWPGRQSPSIAGGRQILAAAAEQWGVNKKRRKLTQNLAFLSFLILMTWLAHVNPIKSAAAGGQPESRHQRSAYVCFSSHDLALCEVSLLFMFQVCWVRSISFLLELFCHWCSNYGWQLRQSSRVVQLFSGSLLALSAQFGNEWVIFDEWLTWRQIIFQGLATTFL